MFYVRFYVDLTKPFVQLNFWEVQPSPYPHIIDFVIISYLLILAIFSWYYRNVKRSYRFKFVHMTTETRLIAQNFFAEINVINKDLIKTLGYTGYDEADKIRFINKSRKYIIDLLERIKNFSEDEMGEF